VKSHYELLSLTPAADAEAIKKAFRREIARYHPDKVVHLGAEFQDMAAMRAAELTVAYKTLSDAMLREEYDASLAAGVPLTHVPPASWAEAGEQEQPAPPPVEPDTLPPPPGTRGRFASERADRDLILKRAITGRVLALVEALYGKIETPAVPGFDLAMVPIAKPRFLGAHPPRVLVKVVATADAAAIAEAYGAASRARLHAGQSPVVVLLFARTIAPQPELSKANEANARGRKAPGSPEEVAVVVVDTADWSCRPPQDCSSAVHKLTDQICLHRRPS
jgi:curved DNA-binding protein CbpA